MSVNIRAAFNRILSLQSREVTYYQVNTMASATISIAPSNYFRNLAALEDTITQGREYVISKDVLDAASLTRPRRGDKVTDPELGNSTVSEVREMIILGDLVGYRVRFE